MSNIAVGRSAASAGVHPMIERFHFGDDSIRAEGTFCVRRGRSVIARVASLVLRLPREGRDVRLALRIERDGDRDIWDRVIDGRSLRTSFHCRHAEAVERIGVLELRYDVRIEGGVLRLSSRSSAFWVGPVAMALPRTLCLRVKSRTCVRAGESCMRACVVVFLPVGGLLLAYRGFVAEVK